MNKVSTPAEKPNRQKGGKSMFTEGTKSNRNSREVQASRSLSFFRFFRDLRDIM